MELYHASLTDCQNARGLAVVIDVIRAFTTAPYAFAAGVEKILPVSEVKEAFALKQSIPNSLLMGEVAGWPPAGFDFGNSPSALIGLDLNGNTLIQRTSAGTQGLTRVPKAALVLAASFAVASATIARIQQLNPKVVTLVCTGASGEDQALAHYLQACLENKTPDPAPFLQQVRDAGEWRLKKATLEDKPTVAQLAQLKADIDCCAALDTFDFALDVKWAGGRLTMHPQRQSL